MACSVTGTMILVEIQILKEGMNISNYHKHLWAKVSCTQIMMEATKEIGQRDTKWATEDCYLCRILFSSNSL